MQIIDNFEYSGIKDLDNRKIWDSFADLRANTNILMPIGFEVYCKEEKKYYVLTYGNENDPTTYIWRVNNKFEKNLIYTTHEIVTAPKGFMREGMDLYGMNVMEVINKMFKFYTKAHLYFIPNVSPNGITYDNPIKKEKLKLNVRVETGSEYIPDGTQINIYKNAEYNADGEIISTPIESISYQNSISNYYVSSDVIEDINDNTEFIATLSFTNMAGKTEILKKYINFEFVPYVYWGASDSNKIDNINLNSSKGFKMEMDYDMDILTRSFTNKIEYCYIITPVELVKILDQNSFDNTNSFDKKEIFITYPSGTRVKYYLYTNDLPITCKNFEYRFYFKDVEPD